ncbi:hypothetical protein [Desulfitobacterium dehalogenans]|uniref:hypothetical protein n=1 Tax=Desulfitobacterium dehalogenans TaxID=36854 RepID=UPI00030512F0|nr:hypothetical protein [Desulfitobacterium dehalogenans]
MRKATLLGLFQVISEVISRVFPRVADHAASGVGKAEKAAWIGSFIPHRSAQT